MSPEVAQTPVLVAGRLLTPAEAAQKSEVMVPVLAVPSGVNTAPTNSGARVILVVGREEPE